MLTTIKINLGAMLPPADRVTKAPFVPTYRLPYAQEGALYYQGPSVSAVLQQFDAFDVYITVLEVRAREPADLPIAVTAETLQRDLHWLYQLKGAVTVEAVSEHGRRWLRLAEGRQTQVYSHELPVTLRLTEPHTLSVAIVAKRQWLIRHRPVERRPVEPLITYLQQHTRRCVTARETAVDEAMPYLAELLSLPKLEGEPMDAAIAGPVGQLVRLARSPAAVQERNAAAVFAATLRRQVDNHIQAGTVPTVEGLADNNGMEAHSLSVRYRQASDHPLSEYIVRARLAEGLRLMIEEQLPVSAAALAIGYAETSVFSKQFKKVYGVSPRAYLKRWGR